MRGPRTLETKYIAIVIETMDIGLNIAKEGRRLLLLRAFFLKLKGVAIMKSSRLCENSLWQVMLNKHKTGYRRSIHQKRWCKIQYDIHTCQHQGRRQSRYWQYWKRQDRRFL